MPTPEAKALLGLSDTCQVPKCGAPSTNFHQEEDGPWESYCRAHHEERITQRVPVNQLVFLGPCEVVPETS